MKAWEITSAGGIEALQLNERPAPEPGPGQVAVKLAANSINYRDLSTTLDPEARGLPYPSVPNSDGAGTVTALGAGVTGIEVGERVAGCFFQDWTAGPITPAAMASALGGNDPAVGGMLAEDVVLNARGVVPVPAHLSLAEAATLPCAALTAWHALMCAGGVKAGDTVLLLGTGGVSVFAQQFCALMGATTVVTSSSDEKLDRMTALGAGATINYRTTPEWERAVIEATGGGADRVVEVGGPGTLGKSIQAVRVGGTVALIGILTGAGGEIVPTDIMRKSLTVQGIYVGSREMFRAMNRAIDRHQLRPVIDETFAFADAPDAFRRMRSARHFGKLVIEM
ncbi:MAG: NAD(P)-dependent alcohol dehydrogenase [Magnetovibrio sp.]|nr:NAD(P)-dependent alcohol dehydrogenase [Magnetovibrio sp.]